jgi:hypothetical protein
VLAETHALKLCSRQTFPSLFSSLSLALARSLGHPLYSPYHSPCKTASKGSNFGLFQQQQHNHTALREQGSRDDSGPIRRRLKHTAPGEYSKPRPPPPGKCSFLQGSKSDHMLAVGARRRRPQTARASTQTLCFNLSVSFLRFSVLHS